MAQQIFESLTSNLEANIADPSTPLDTRLFEEAELILPETLPADGKVKLISLISQLLQTIQQDPTPAVNLLLRLLQEYSYSDVLRLGSNAIPYTSGLAVGDHMVSFNRLILAILRKATLNAADAASVAGMLDTVLALVRLWLCTGDTGIASQASQLLLDLLRIDQSISRDPNEALPSGGQGLMWKRMFGDQDVYRTMFEACSLTGKGPGDVNLSKSQRTLAQARLLEWLPRVGRMDWSAIERSHHAVVEKEFGVEDGGLLDFAALRMVDTKDDVLMYRCLIDFFSDLLQCAKTNIRIPGSGTPDSPGLRYLISQGLHARTAAIYVQLPGVQLDPLETMFLYGPAANYIATYASDYPDHFLASQMPKQVLERLSTTLNLSPAKWAHADSPKHDLHVLASLPRKALLAISGTDDWRSSPLSLVPSKATNADALNTLATIFHGPSDSMTYDMSTAQQQDIVDTEEATHARALYYNYLSHNPKFWSDIVTHADTIALKDLALSALNVLHSVITATWPSTSSPSQSPQLPTDLATPPTGHLAIPSPPSLEYTLPYLLKPPQTFANLVGGRGDTESAAYKIAATKFDALKAFHGRLQHEVQRSPGEGYEEILATVAKRLAEGPLSREGEVGGRIGTLEL